ncbi:MBL fold metallo-hydrolase [Halolamina sp. C58]|uniref:MBL fold metallo-hydrolase n=1 Tax=Halolamina sp. C58 TaxID=3421640 RepID=UPI003EBD9E5D
MSEKEAEAPAVDAAELAAWQREGRAFTVLDVRNRDEFEAWHVDAAEAVQIAHQQFIAARAKGTTEELIPDGPEPILVVCGVGEASAEVADQLRETGVDARNLAGGMDAWAREYEAVELLFSGGTLLQYQRPSSGCLGYLLVSGDEAAVIDPLRAFADRYAEDAAAHGATIQYAIDTHVHADHVSGVRAVAAATGARVTLPAGASERGVGFEPDRLLADGETLSVGDAVLETIELPGHTPEGVGFRIADEEHGDVLLAGDTLFLDAVARPDLAVEGGAVEAMARALHGSLSKLLNLPDGTRVAPGHVASATSADGAGRYVATVGDLRERHGLLSLREDEFVERVTGSLPERPANDEQIIRINSGTETVDDETALDLELGPNNCAAR